ncbi:MAG: acetolactate synthase large subunit [Gammaproteobacteria bacterium]
MNGAEALLKTLVDAGLEICFANPGTSEMHLVSAIGKADTIRPILCLFEGVVTGAADGYARMAGKPALTLLHLGPGLANGMANLHNAKKAHVPLVNVVGDHAPYHLPHNAPLTSDVKAHAAINSVWVETSTSANDLARLGAIAVQKACQGTGKISTLIAPANHAWEKASQSYTALPTEPPTTVPKSTIESAAALLTNGKKTALILGGYALREDALVIAGRIAAKFGVPLFGETFPTRHQRGSGRVSITRVPYFAEQAIQVLGQFEQFVLLGAATPVAFFAYPDTPSVLVPDDATVMPLATIEQNVVGALESLAENLGATPGFESLQQRVIPEPPSGALSALTIGDTIAALLPENAIIADEGITCSAEIFSRTVGAAPHDILAITGGAIGQGLPVSFGAAIACPDRKIVALQADGSAMYTVQTLWSMARENTDTTVVLLNNDSYAILNIELARLKTHTPNDKTLSMLDIGHPSLDWQSIARGMNVNASRATTAEEFHMQFKTAMEKKGPHLIEAMIQQDVMALFNNDD